MAKITEAFQMQMQREVKEQMARDGVHPGMGDEELHAKDYYRDERGSVLPFAYMTDEERRKRTLTHPPTDAEVDELNRIIDETVRTGKEPPVNHRMEEVARYVTGIDAMEGEYEAETEVVGDGRGELSGHGDGEDGNTHRGVLRADKGSGGGDRSSEPHRRPTRKLVEQAFNRFCAATNPEAKGQRLELDFYGASGGYRIVTHDQRTPFGSRRHRAKQMIDMMDFAVDAIHYRLRGGI